MTTATKTRATKTRERTIDGERVGDEVEVGTFPAPRLVFTYGDRYSIDYRRKEYGPRGGFRGWYEFTIEGELVSVYRDGSGDVRWLRLQRKDGMITAADMGRTPEDLHILSITRTPRKESK